MPVRNQGGGFKSHSDRMASSRSHALRNGLSIDISASQALPCSAGLQSRSVTQDGQAVSSRESVGGGGGHPDCLRPNLAIRWRVVVRGKMKEGVGNEILTAHIHRHKRETVDKCEGHLEIQSFVLAGVGLSTLV